MLTNNAFIEIAESIRKAHGDNEMTCGISVDPQGHFGNANLDILVAKLEELPIVGFDHI